VQISPQGPNTRTHRLKLDCTNPKHTSRYETVTNQSNLTQQTAHMVATRVNSVLIHVDQIDPVRRHERCSDDESDSYPWIGYHLSSIRRGVCLALRDMINPCGMPV
jgi:hypothetical protein